MSRLGEMFRKGFKGQGAALGDILRDPPKYLGHPTASPAKANGTQPPVRAFSLFVQVDAPWSLGSDRIQSEGQEVQRAIEEVIRKAAPTGWRVKVGVRK